jgi:hypothetical protein
MPNRSTNFRKPGKEAGSSVGAVLKQLRKG